MSSVLKTQGDVWRGQENKQLLHSDIHILDIWTSQITFYLIKNVSCINKNSEIYPTIKRSPIILADYIRLGSSSTSSIFV